MAHHQAMIVVAIGSALQNGPMRARFHAEPTIQAVELLLQERMPRDVAVARPPPEAGQGGSAGCKPHSPNSTPLHVGTLSRSPDPSYV